MYTTNAALAVSEMIKKDAPIQAATSTPGTEITSQVSKIQRRVQGRSQGENASLRRRFDDANHIQAITHTYYLDIFLVAMILKSPFLANL